MKKIAAYSLAMFAPCAAAFAAQPTGTEWKEPETLCGWVKNIGREGQEKGLSTLEDLPKEPIDMFTTVFIGSSNTIDCGGRMVTPRGYEKKR